MDLAGKRLGVAVLARPTFDVPFAEDKASAALAALDATEAEIVGPRELLFDQEATEAAIATLKDSAIDGLVIVQATFTDAAMTLQLAEAVSVPLVLWAFPEPRTGGRLRLNSFCGINLAGHTLLKAGIRYGYLFGEPSEIDLSSMLGEAFGGMPMEPAGADAFMIDPLGGERISEALGQSKIGLIGEHPAGFETCAFDEVKLAGLTGTKVDRGGLDGLFEAAKAVDPAEVSTLKAEVEAVLAGADDMEAEPLDKCLRSFAALKSRSGEDGIDAYAVRCWPEFFTDYGCAACGAMAMLGEDGTPCACEADVFGAVTLLMLRSVANDPPFLADLVDIDAADDSVVFWHCGLAPISLADPTVAPAATIHSNRRKPLLNEFPLKPGRITVARLSQSKGEVRMVLGLGDMLTRPNSFSGTSGVARMDRSAGDVSDAIMGEGLEHHYAIAYGDHTASLAGWAAKAGVPVVRLA